MINEMPRLPDMWRFFKSAPLVAVGVAVAGKEGAEEEETPPGRMDRIPHLIHQKVNDD
jgi:hypothetical protein